MQQDSEQYLKRRQFFDSLLTIYGRLSVLEALHTPNIQVHKLHLAESNKPAGILNEIIALAEKLGAQVEYHEKRALSRISKNAKQDQGVALDIAPSQFQVFNEHFKFRPKNTDINEYIALDGVSNPQNLGMIIRSICASPIKGLFLPKQGCAKLDPLVIKASAGTLFKAPIIHCDQLSHVIDTAKKRDVDIIGLDLKAKHTLSEYTNNNQNASKTSRIFILGNESTGLSEVIQKACTQRIKIPMHNEVESLNVAVTASMIALRHQL